MQLLFDILAARVTAVVLAFAWTGAVAWPVAVAGAAWAFPRLRRSWLASLFAGGVTFAWVLGLWAFLVEPRLLVVREIVVESPAWTGRPLRLGVVSDVHIGPHMSPGRVARIAERMNGLEPDLVLLVGDYVGGHAPPDERSDRENAEIEKGLAQLGGFAAPLGTVAVLGNHDWWYDGPGVGAALEAAGVAVLENEALGVDRGESGTFWLAGLADYESETMQPDWDAALAPAPPGTDLLAFGHWPDVFAGAPQRVALTVAGHSHCGQVVLPFLGRPAVSSGSAIWPCGFYEEAGRRLFVTGGVGVSVLPARFRAPPEIVVITLQGAGPA